MMDELKKKAKMSMLHEIQNLAKDHMGDGKKITIAKVEGEPEMPMEESEVSPAEESLDESPVSEVLPEGSKEEIISKIQELLSKLV